MLALCIALGGTAWAASKISGRNIKKGTIPLSALSNSAKKALKGPRGAAGAQGPAGSARVYGLVNNNGATVKLQKAKGSPSVRRSGNGIFCIKASGISPSDTPIVATEDASGAVANVVIATGSGPTISSQCHSDEFQVAIIDVGSGLGANNVSFNFVIP